jgi:hypothetical protein
MSKKLTLAQETLRVLDDADLVRVVGGGDHHGDDEDKRRRHHRHHRRHEEHGHKRSW